MKFRRLYFYQPDFYQNYNQIHRNSRWIDFGTTCVWTVIDFWLNAYSAILQALGINATNIIDTQLGERRVSALHR